MDFRRPPADVGGAMMHDPSNVLQHVSRSLKRSGTAAVVVPPPPTIDEPIARLVYSDIGLSKLFAKHAAELKMIVEMIRIDNFADDLAGFLETTKSKRVMLSDTPLLQSLAIDQALIQKGFDARFWSTMTLDESYDFDAGVTEVDYAVAETGSLVIRHRPAQGRALSLVPFVHVAIVQPKNMVADLIDLMEKLNQDGTGSGVTMISGPSKTADIEMNVVTGVHGPNIVKAYVLE